MKKLAGVVLLIACLTYTYAQDTLDIGFTRQYGTAVTENGRVLQRAWLGGLNSVQFSELDINLDGTLDLLLFDRVGDILLPFINNGTPDSSDYTYNPDYIADFPSFRQWAIFRDYDMDGKKDMFTYSVGGIAVYRNVSDTSLKWEMKTFLLNSFYYINYINIYLTDVDYPGIYDIDQDGDLDILTFFGLGSFIEFHQNMSMEKYGVPDSLDFMMADKCWGRFYESELNNLLTLNVPCPYKDCEDGGGIPYSRGPSATEHTGSTFLLLDMNADSLVELILGDVDYPTVIQLNNGGTLDSAHIVSQDTNFPLGTKPIDLVSFPALNYLDLDNDGIKELVASPFDPSPILPDNYHSVWYYENLGQNDQPQFEFKTDVWMQGDMIDLGGGAYPAFIDEDADGLMDMIVGNYGYRDTSWYDMGFLYSSYQATLALFRNVGSADDPAFELVDRDYANVKERDYTGAVPAFGDLDGDGDLDMLLGKEDGEFGFYRNQAGPGQPLQLQFETDSYQNLDVGRSSAPQIIDLNEDGLPDIVSGRKEGTLVYFENQGTLSSPAFTWITDTLGGVDIREDQISWSGYSTPAFIRDTLDSLRLYVGGLSGLVSYYRGINAKGDTFELIDPKLVYIDAGQRSAPGLHDLDADDVPDLVIGNYRGGLIYYKGISNMPAGLEDETDPITFRIFPNPANTALYVQPEEWVRNTELAVFDLSGRRLIQQAQSQCNPCMLNVSGLQPGAYLLRLTKGDREKRSASKLFIKQ